MTSPAGRLLALTVLLGLSVAGCAPSTEPEVMAGVDECGNCRMVIDQVNQAAGYVRDRGFVPFDSPACLLARFEELRKADAPMPRAVYFADFETGEFLPSDTATFLLTSHHPTVMGGEVLVFASRDAAQGLQEHDDEVVTDWLGYRTVRGEPDRRVAVTLSQEGLDPEKVEVEKGELVEWTITAAERGGEPIEITIKGYPELDAVAIPVDGSPLSFRLLASRPGDGFPIIGGATGDVLGIVVVRGPHTADEEAEGM